MFLMAFSLNQGLSQSFGNASEYLDFVAYEKDDLATEIWRFTTAIPYGRNDINFNSKRQRLLKLLEECITRIKMAQDYANSGFKDEVLSYLQSHRELLQKDYAKIIDMKAMAEQSYSFMEAYILAQEMAHQKMEASRQAYEANLESFANANNIEINDDEAKLSEKMKTSNEVFGYYNDLYLIYFKVFINEIHLMDAIEQNDVDAIQLIKYALNKAAKEGLKALETQQAYNGDTSIIEATGKAFKFFIEESKKTIPEITAFLILNEDFEKFRNTLDQMDERKRTNEQINEYNERVKEVNAGINTFNWITTELNESREELIDTLNKVYADFFARHLPN